MPPDPVLRTLFEHGGALHAARRLFPKARQPWLDLSTGINPRPYVFAAPAMAAWARLPDAAALAELECTAAVRYGAPAHVATVAAPGTQAIIGQLPALVGGTDVRLLGPTYGEFERVFRAAGARVTIVADPADLVGADTVVAVNPNNPDGRCLLPTELLRLAPLVGTLVVDEAFADALPPEASLIPLLPERTIVLRSFGKVYGLAGLRLGFAVLSAERAVALRARLGPWPVSGPAIAIGTQALADPHWLAHTRRWLHDDGSRLGALLAQAGTTPVGATPLFRLVAHRDAARLFRRLAEQGILVRPFTARDDWLRFGLPGSEDDWERLAQVLRGLSP